MLNLEGRILLSAKLIKRSGIISTGGVVMNAVVKDPFHEDGWRQEFIRSSSEKDSGSSDRDSRL